MQEWVFLFTFVMNLKPIVMTITLITKETYNKLLDIANKYPKLTYQNKGYDSLKMDTLTEEETAKFKEVQEVLKKVILGFSKFNHFKIQPTTQKLLIRFQYDWSADINSIPFIGVGYLELEELYKGFKENQV